MRNTPRIMVRPDRLTIQGLVGWTDARRPTIGVALDTPKVQIVDCTLMARPHWWQVRRWWECLKALGVVP